MRAAVEVLFPDFGSSVRVCTRNEEEFAHRLHYHAEYELNLIVQSQGTRYVGDSVQEYGPGDLVLVGSNLPHTWHSAPGKKREKHRAVFLQFREADYFDWPELIHIRRLLEVSQHGIQFHGKTRDLADVMMQELATLTGVPRLTKFLALLDLLSRGKEYTQLSSLQIGPRGKSVAQRRIDRACKFIHENYRRPIEQRELADQLGMTPAAFSRLFRRVTGLTFVHYVNQVRVKHACTLLAESSESISQISLDSGFENLSNFNRQFLRWKKVTPRNFRQQYQ
ncbi:MAG: AraC family transcriptional regulator [Planctomycetota bacterium]|nr:AraC family transcriptional regulator [Planctomycetota bacterium]